MDNYFIQTGTGYMCLEKAATVRGLEPLPNEEKMQHLEYGEKD